MNQEQMINDILIKIALCVEKGKVNAKSLFPPEMKGEDGASELTEQALKMGVTPNIVLNDGLMVGMKKIGIKFRDNKIFVPDVLIAAKAMKAAMEHIKPFFHSGEVDYKGTIVMGTVLGDLHDIGKNIAIMIIEGGGWKVVDLGVDAGADKFINAIKVTNASAVGLSALLTSTMLNMEKIIKIVKEEFPNVKALVGGAPLNQQFANQINADFYSHEPQGALDFLNSLKN